ncbi:hypothetical protein B0T17DRAFT_361404 [Bombardia bombarda]|uniref:Uncharacterized protein n=1 Tax=Bombardia bombarda TaxID=252184 RepID=A0AA40BW57_9PEZI|nr:hypothetical protein B0T17DRAFT_361404 [Bombardia bombarda]
MYDWDTCVAVYLSLDDNFSFLFLSLVFFSSSFTISFLSRCIGWVGGKVFYSLQCIMTASRDEANQLILEQSRTRTNKLAFLFAPFEGMHTFRTDEYYCYLSFRIIYPLFIFTGYILSLFLSIPPSISLFLFLFHVATKSRGSGLYL